MRPTKAVTLYDVAAAAGVSPKTVSRVINDDPQVLPATRQRVQAAVQTLNYQPNPLARSLRTGSDRTIGLVVESVDDAFFAAIAAVVEQQLNQAGYAVYIVSTYRDAAREQVTLEGLLQRRVAGLIVAPSMAHTSWYANCPVPLIFIDRTVPGCHVDVVGVDDAAGSQMATEHLIAHGHRRIGYIGGPSGLPTAAARLQGYRQALTQAGLSAQASWKVSDVITPQDGTQAAQQLMGDPQPVTAVFVAAARCLSGVVTELRHFPQTALVSFGDVPLAAAVQPGISVIDHSAPRIGALASELLLAQLSGTGRPPASYEVALTLIPRGSGELRPVHQ